MKLLNKIKWLLGIIFGGILLVLTAKQVCNIGKVGIQRNWKKVPGSDKDVFVKNKYKKWVKVQLPYNQYTKKQITTNDIKSIGLSYTDERDVKVEIKHKPTDRRVNGDSNSDMSI